MIVRTLIVSIFLAAGQVAALACSCFFPDAKGIMETSDLVFEARLISSRLGDVDTRVGRFAVLEIFKGQLAPETEVPYLVTSTCAVRLREGERLVVFGPRSRLRMNLCNIRRETSPAYEDFKAELRSLKDK